MQSFLGLSQAYQSNCGSSIAAQRKKCRMDMSFYIEQKAKSLMTVLGPQARLPST